MSYLGEARGFARIRDKIRHKLDTEKLSPAERTSLLAEEREYDLEYRCAWSAARQEAMETERDIREEMESDEEEAA